MTRRGVILFFSVLIFLTGIFLFNKNCLAAVPLDVVINEVAWMGTATSTFQEWIELKNNTDSVIDLSGWILYASTTATKSMPLKNSIGPQDYYLLSRSNYEISIPADATSTSLSLTNTGMFLELRDNENNVIDSVDYLRSSPYWFFGNNITKHTMERINSLLPATIDNWQNSEYPHGSPRAVNYFNIAPVANAGTNITSYIGDEIIFDGSLSSDSDGVVIQYDWDFGDGGIGSGVTTTHMYLTENIFNSILKVTDDKGAYATTSIMVTILPLESTSTESTSTPFLAKPSDVVINEFMADPITGEQEWIELFNNTTSTIDLLGWHIFDGSGATTTLTGIILPQGYFIIDSPKGNLNNAGDVIILKDETGIIIDGVAYGNWNGGTDNAPIAGKGFSVARSHNGVDSDNDKNDFSETTNTTKGTTNIIVAKSVASSGGGGGGSATIIPVQVVKTFQSGDITINEIVSDPADGESEWIELYNTTGESIELSGWTIVDGSSSKTPLSGIISSHGFVVVAKPMGSLNNNGDIIFLKDVSGKIIDRLTYGDWDDGNKIDNAVVASDPYSLARINDGFISGSNKDDFAITASTTKGLPNIIKSQSDVKRESTTTTAIFSDEDAEIIITEIYPNPDGKDEDEEFVELFNDGDKDIDLAGWVLDDGDGGSRPFKIGAVIINSGSYLAFNRKTIGLALNNNFDVVRLYNSVGKLIDEVNYTKSPKGSSYSLNKNDKWQWTKKITKSAENKFEDEVVGAGVSAVKKVSTAKKSSNVVVKGTVLVEPGLLGTQIFYIDGMQVYCFKKDFPALSRGDVIEVSGELSEGTDEPRIKITGRQNIKILKRATQLSAQKVSIGDIGETLNARLIEIAGEVVEVKGGSIFVDDGTDEMKVYIKESTDIKKLGVKDGDLVKVTGIMSELKSGYRLLPRYASDIVIEKKGEVKGEQETAVAVEKNSGTNKYLIAIIVFMALIFLRLGWWRLKNKKIATSDD